MSCFHNAGVICETGKWKGLFDSTCYFSFILEQSLQCRVVLRNVDGSKYNGRKITTLLHHTNFIYVALLHYWCLKRKFIFILLKFACLVVIFYLSKCELKVFK